MCQLDWLKIFDWTLFLEMSVRVFPGEVRIWIGRIRTVVCLPEQPLLVQCSRNCHGRPSSLYFYWIRTCRKWTRQYFCIFLFLHLQLLPKTSLVFKIWKHKYPYKNSAFLSYSTIYILNLHNPSVNSITSFRNFCMFIFTTLFPDHKSILVHGFENEVKKKKH